MKGLIIQGPLLSKGRTGKTIGTSFHDVTDNDVVEYDCIENIKRIYDDNVNFYDHIVCVTWDNQASVLINRLQKILPKNCILLISDETKDMLAKGGVIGGNNDYRQFLSINKGVTFLQGKGCKYIAKVRTDQYLDCKLLCLDAIEKLENRSSRSIVVPWRINEFNRFTFIPDFYFVARTQDMLDFSDKFLSLPDVTGFIHTNIFYKWKLKKGKQPKVIRKFIRYTDRFGLNFISHNLLSSDKDFITSDSIIAKSIIWRGDKIDESFLRDKCFISIRHDDMTRVSMLHVFLKVYAHLIIKIKRRFV